ncbi:phosphocholine cytidylyltransferase family protein [Rhizobiales bacterium]|uniref:phosphocholine cytidylyltransferase family protein n=1 Tax=Hongsoonwoonella zoysiae TaxID=2821844 RepID=UPI00156000F7|nr:phosphocholine cytidylyltransferase family protein [Hongsoonwoonella zoysiae]NRG16651.1 phosphocholine cytidylyltransferase family protein [Hongsoonwoonella zoysiae]
MRDYTAVILAAGRGVRMGSRGELSPKGLLRFGERSFVGESIANLKRAGVARIRIVTGHLADHYERAAQNWPEGVDLRHNPDFVEKGSLHSLMVGLEGLDGPVIVLESDLVYEPRALEPIDPEGSRSTLVVSGPTGAGDEVYVWADDAPAFGCKRLRDMSKERDLHPDPHYGELVGIIGLARDAVMRVKEIAPEMIANKPLADYEDGLVAAAHKTEIGCFRIDDLAWAEVDDEAMFARAAERIYPQIATARSIMEN